MDWMVRKDPAATDPAQARRPAAVDLERSGPERPRDATAVDPEQPREPMAMDLERPRDPTAVDREWARDPTAVDLERASERWLAWVAVETTRRRRSPGSDLLVLWDVLEEWFASDDFTSSPVAAAVSAPPDGRGPAVHAVLVRHRQATRRLLEDLARSSEAPDPAVLAGQLLTLVEGAIAGVMIDRHVGVARHARELTRIALMSPRESAYGRRQ
jgi:hypothetical protein